MPKNHYTFIQADVFTNTPFGGNQLAVFPDGRGLTTNQMQSIALEMNFSETTFVLPPETPGASRRIRIFTPYVEMPMAGHPTVGTTYVLVEKGLVEPAPGTGEVIFDLGIGPVKVHIEQMDGGSYVWMTHRPAVFSDHVPDRDAIATALGIKSDEIRDDLPLQIVSTGVPFLMVPMKTLAAAKKSRSESAALSRLFAGYESASIELFTTETELVGSLVHVRMYAPHTVGVVEDPATGSAAAPLGAYLARYGVLPGGEGRFWIEQGLEMKRPSRILVEVIRNSENIEKIRIGGQTVIVAEGELFWD
ncbi:MAG TPA: PhzF family phenazine biosynthesis protein [Anaerolineaceae bacterium]